MNILFNLINSLCKYNTYFLWAHQTGCEFDCQKRKYQELFCEFSNIRHSLLMGIWKPSTSMKLLIKSVGLIRFYKMVWYRPRCYSYVQTPISCASTISFMYFSLESMSCKREPIQIYTHNHIYAHVQAESKMFIHITTNP